jgi:hypothetical protein|tara:strand:- start:380 stop:490 length:111 start_codon:yes stop_codon:yes gene_type:complete
MACMAAILLFISTISGKNGFFVDNEQLESFQVAVTR